MEGARALLNTIEAIRSDHRRRTRADGSASSGNWGHVGRPGQVGGSQKGGGSAFRMLKTSAGKYTSQAKMRDDAKKAYRAAMESGNQKSIDRILKRMSKINMNVKTADVTKEKKPGYDFVRRIDINASRNILKDENRGKPAWETSVTKAKGTNEAIRYAFPKRVVRGGNGSKGGKTKVSNAK